MLYALIEDSSEEDPRILIRIGQRFLSDYECMLMIGFAETWTHAYTWLALVIYQVSSWLAMRALMCTAKGLFMAI